MDKIKGKKAILMTITALMISLLFFVIFSKENILPSFYTSQPVNTRVKAIDNYVKTIPVFMGDSLEIATYDALNSIYLEQSKNGIFYLNKEQFYFDLQNCIRCGHPTCFSPSVLKCEGMKNTDLDSVITNVSNLAKEHLNLQSSFTIYGIEVTQNYPYDVDVRLDIGYYVNDGNFGISWDKRENITRVVSIIGLKDPLLGINTAQSSERPILRSTICEFNETCWDYNRTTAFYNSKAFTYSIEGTSFLSRYWNSTDSSECCGIETFILDPDPRNISFLDHYYFTGEYICPFETILLYDDIYVGFKLDSKTAGRYHITDNYTALICRP